LQNELDQWLKSDTPHPDADLQTSRLIRQAYPSLLNRTTTSIASNVANDLASQLLAYHLPRYVNRQHSDKAQRWWCGVDLCSDFLFTADLEIASQKLEHDIRIGHSDLVANPGQRITMIPYRARIDNGWGAIIGDTASGRYLILDLSGESQRAEGARSLRKVSQIFHSSGMELDVWPSLALFVLSQVL
jgi:hypothetical protein